MSATSTDRRARRRELIRREILDAAWELAREQGLAGLAMRDLGARVGMRAQSLYSYFPSKHAIYDAMFAQGNRELFDRVVALDAEDGSRRDPETRLRRLTEIYLEFSAEDPVRHQLLNQRPIPGFEPSAECYQLAVEALALARAVLHDCGVTPPRIRHLDRPDRWAGRPAERQRARWNPLAAAGRRGHRHVPAPLPTRTRRTTMNAATPVDLIPPLDHDEAMTLADTEIDRLLALVDDLTADDWPRPTDCTGWTVRDMLGHLLGMFELQADREERMRQIKTAAERASRSGQLRLTELTALQVREHADLTVEQLRQQLHQTAPRGLAARRALPADLRATPYDPELPGERMWTLGYLFDIIHTRDPWLHRVDICRATRRDLLLTAEHDGRIVANVVADWAPRHGRPFVLELTGPAGATFTAGTDGPHLQMDAIEFCRTLSGREEGTGILATRITF